MIKNNKTRMTVIIVLVYLIALLVFDYNYRERGAVSDNRGLTEDVGTIETIADVDELKISLTPELTFKNGQVTGDIIVTNKSDETILNIDNPEKPISIGLSIENKNDGIIYKDLQHIGLGCSELKPGEKIVVPITIDGLTDCNNNYGIKITVVHEGVKWSKISTDYWFE